MIRILTATAAVALFAAPVLAQQQSPADQQSAPPGWSDQQSEMEQDQTGAMPAIPEEDDSLRSQELGAEDSLQPDVEAPQQAQIPGEDDSLIREEPGIQEDRGSALDEEVGQSPETGREIETDTPSVEE